MSAVYIQGSGEKHVYLYTFNLYLSKQTTDERMTKWRERERHGGVMSPELWALRDDVLIQVHQLDQTHHLGC